MPSTLDEKIIMDIDLSSFGHNWEDFKINGIKIREEQSFLTDKEFYNKQIKFQKSLLKRNRFYFSDYFFERFEKTARKNLLRYLQSLDVKGYEN